MAAVLTYKLHLIRLNCFRSDEKYGDEVFLKMSDEKIWPVAEKYRILGQSTLQNLGHEGIQAECRPTPELCRRKTQANKRVYLCGQTTRARASAGAPTPGRGSRGASNSNLTLLNKLMSATADPKLV